MPRPGTYRVSFAERTSTGWEVCCGGSPMPVSRKNAMEVVSDYRDEATIAVVLTRQGTTCAETYHLGHRVGFLPE